jgi:hypothetical protein
MDARRAFDAIWSLAADHERTLPLLKQRLQPSPPIDSRKIEGWIAELNSEVYAKRQKASRALEALGERIESALKQALRSSLTLEHRRRIELLLQKIDQQSLTVAQIRELRAVEVLERIGNASACNILETLVAGAPDTRLTQEAAFALARLKSRQQSDPR